MTCISVSSQVGRDTYERILTVEKNWLTTVVGPCHSAARI